MRQLTSALLLLALATAAQAHFVFIVPEGDARKARVVFSDSTAPDKAELLEKIAHTKFALVVDGKTTELKATEGTNALNLQAKGTGPAWITGVTPYGVIAKGKVPFLLTYYSKAAVGCSGECPEALRKPLKELKLDLVPLGKDTVQVLWYGKPLAATEVVLYVPGKDEQTVASDKDGKVKLPSAVKSGPYAVRTRHIAMVKGEKDGNKYDEERSYATLVFTATAEKTSQAVEKTTKEDPEATKLLADARKARANWDNFPGFTADIAVNAEGKVNKGKMTVTAKGKVDLDLDGDQKDWARRVLASLAGHRMDDSSTLTTPCGFSDNAPYHPLGRGIQVLNDEHHSSYRIRDRQVIEVNRTMGDSRFTIAVMENRVNAEKKFLPGSYVVNTWDAKTGALRSSVTHHNTWKRVGTFDLPETVTVLTATAGKQVTRTIKVSNAKLSAR